MNVKTITVVYGNKKFELELASNITLCVCKRVYSLMLTEKKQQVELELSTDACEVATTETKGSCDDRRRDTSDLEHSALTEL